MNSSITDFQDQAISVITDICSRSKTERGSSEQHQACILMINILDRALFLEICVSRICAMGPSSARSDDFMREFKRLIEGKSDTMLFLSSLFMLKNFVASMHQASLESHQECLGISLLHAFNNFCTSFILC